MTISAESIDSRRAKLHRPAEDFYVGCNPDDRAELDRVIRNLCLDSQINNRTTYAFAMPPAIFVLYRDARFWIVFHLPNADSLVIYNIGHAERTLPTVD